MPVLGAGDILLGALTLSAERSHFRRPSIGQLSDILIDGARELTSLFGGDTTIFYHSVAGVLRLGGRRRHDNDERAWRWTGFPSMLKSRSWSSLHHEPR